MFLKALVVTVCLIKLASTQSSDPDPCNSFNITDTIGQMKLMLRSSCINGKKFVLWTAKTASWFRADNICRFNQMQLAMINSAEEQALVSNLIDRSSFANNRLWTSGNDLACPRNWYWSSNGSPIKYYSWKAGEPNNFLDTNERCINLMPKVDNYQWNDAPCDHSYYFICEEKCGCDKTKF
ncbi:C-type lectin mannose-binding isoform-like [Bradysia coprophila]|uniref:C-type lectin mannose-binding isoform-like n=1 Tax=Bradysia coprophila TaxID=38358 RepID=UPI00187DD1E7|nr:C-type lectin mannose-binding isoform-like [Bradysia coprophila]